MATERTAAEKIEDDAGYNSSSKSSVDKQEEGNAAAPQQWADSEEKALVKRLDRRIFPMLCIVFGLSLLDRSNISAAYIAGLDKDIGLAVGSRYSIALLVFFIGYALFELPSNMVIRRVGARYWLSFLIISWGTCVLGMGFVHSWISLTVLRVLLGIFEAGLFPGAIFIISSWYKQYETASRLTLFYMASLVASGFGPIFAYVLSLISVGDGTYAQGWRWIFIIEGIITIVAGFVAPLFLAEFPEKAKWLSTQERMIAVSRVRIDKKGREYTHPTVKESFKMLWDWKMIVFFFQSIVSAQALYSVSFFMPIILRQGLGFSYALSQLLTSPPYVFTIITSLCAAWISDKYRTRWTIMIFQSMTAVVGLLIALYAGPPGVRYFGLFLAVYGTQSNVPTTLAYAQSQTATIEKKGVLAAAMISVGCIGGIMGSTIFRSQDAPQYYPGMWATIGMQLLYTVVTTVTSLYFKWQNRLADEGKRTALEGVEGFRYAP